MSNRIDKVKIIFIQLQAINHERYRCYRLNQASLSSFQKLTTFVSIQIYLIQIVDARKGLWRNFNEFQAVYPPPWALYWKISSKSPHSFVADVNLLLWILLKDFMRKFLFVTERIRRNGLKALINHPLNVGKKKQRKIPFEERANFLLYCEFHARHRQRCVESWWMPQFFVLRC